MSDTPNQRDAERRLWSEIESHQIGMLGVVGEGIDGFQPMTAFAEPDLGEIWFFSRTDTDFVRRVGESGCQAMFILQDKDVNASVGGRLSVRHDPARMEKYWNAVVAAWYPQGKDDPHITMLRLRADAAEVWFTEAGPVRFAWEIAKANMNNSTPDVGEHARLQIG